MEATIPGGNDSDHSEDQLDLDLLADKLVAPGCDADDILFLLNVLEVTKGKELIPLHFNLLVSSPIKSSASYPAILRLVGLGDLSSI
jgi:hypothetical protein